MVIVMSDIVKNQAETPLSFQAQWHEDVHCVFGRDPAAHSVWEILLTYSGVHAVLMHRISHRLWKANWKLTARILAPDPTSTLLPNVGWRFSLFQVVPPNVTP